MDEPTFEPYPDDEAEDMIGSPPNYLDRDLLVGYPGVECVAYFYPPSTGGAVAYFVRAGLPPDVEKQHLHAARHTTRLLLITTDPTIDNWRWLPDYGCWGMPIGRRT